MNRRDFNSIMARGLAASLVPARWTLGAHAHADLRVDGERLNAHLATLSEIGRNPEGGVSRVA